MDPTACLKRFDEAVADRDKDEIIETSQALHAWIFSGGFKPEMSESDWRKNLSRSQLAGMFKLIHTIALIGD